jgi:anti-anti-sigma factor
VQSSIHGPQTIVLDVEGLADTSPAFVSFLVRARQQSLDAGYRIHLVGVTKKVRRILEVTGLIRFFTYESAE